MNILSKDPAINVDLIVSGDEYDYISKYIDLTVEPINLPSIILKPHYKSIIPLKLYQTWEVKDNLPLNMKNNVDQLKRNNPEFEYFLYDDTMCRDFIKDNFPKDVLYAYDKLIPGAYRADLWRYCILYKNGGVYLDIKYRCMNGFKLIALTEKEYFVRDFENFEEIGIYNALMVCKPDNSILLKCINKIVENCQTEYYGPNYLYPTGPHLLNKYFSKSDIDELEMELHYDENNRVHHIDDKQINYFSIKYRISMDNIHVKYCKVHILEAYPEYVLDRMNHSKNPYYMDCWENKNIYDKSPEKSVAADTPVIPLDIYQTWYTLDLSYKMRENIERLKKQNPEFKHYLYDDTMCRNFIERHFSSDVLFAFDMLKPGAYKADLWRYCILYKKGGIYLDIKFSCVNDFKLINLTDKEYYVIDCIQCGRPGIYQALLICKKSSPILLECIQKVVENCKNYYYSVSPLAITGPQMMNQFFTDEEIYSLELSLVWQDSAIVYKGNYILQGYKEYINERDSVKKHYGTVYFEYDVFMYKWLSRHSLKQINFQNIKISLSQENNLNKENYIFSPLPYPKIIFNEKGKCIIECMYIDKKYHERILPIKDLYYMNYTITFDPLFGLIKEEKSIISNISHYRSIFSQMDVDHLRVFHFKDEIYLNGTFFDNLFKKSYYIVGRHKPDTNSDMRKEVVDEPTDISMNIGKSQSSSTQCDIAQNAISKDDTKVFVKENANVKLSQFDAQSDIFELSQEIIQYNKHICLVDYMSELTVICDWYPLKICKLNHETKKIELFETKIVPDFLKNIYDSTNGYRYKNEIWFICNKIQVIDNIYQSFHLFVVFDTNMNFLRHSEMFKLGEKIHHEDSFDNIHYCTEMIIRNNIVIIAYENELRVSVIEIFNKSFIFNELRYFYS